MNSRIRVMSSRRQDAQKTALSLIHTLNNEVCDKCREGVREVIGLPSHLTREGSALLPVRDSGLAGPSGCVWEACNRAGDFLGTLGRFKSPFSLRPLFRGKFDNAFSSSVG